MEKTRDRALGALVGHEIDVGEMVGALRISAEIDSAGEVDSQRERIALA